jgi:hypothetical protein
MPSILQPIYHRCNLLYKVAENFWLFTESDFFTFVVPNTVFGIACALAGFPLVLVEDGSTGAVLSRIPAVVLFNVRTLYPFHITGSDKMNSGQISLSSILPTSVYGNLSQKTNSTSHGGSSQPGK